jgi:hypothetical protein
MKIYIETQKEVKTAIDKEERERISNIFEEIVKD